MQNVYELIALGLQNEHDLERKGYTNNFNSIKNPLDL